MSDNKNVDNPLGDDPSVTEGIIIGPSSSEVSSIAGSVKASKTSQRMSSSTERQIKFERAQKCLENAALVSKRIKEHRKATAELLGRPFDDDDGDTASEMASTMSERTGYSVATDVSTTLSVQDALNIPGISESLANTLKRKEQLTERIKQYKEIGKRTAKIPATVRKESISSVIDTKKSTEKSSDVANLMVTIKEKETTLSLMQVKIKSMEETILDLQEKINEKDQIIEAKNKATALMSDSLSKKEKDSLSLIEDTKQQMTKMQENFIAMEAEWKEEKKKLLKDIETKDEKISSLEEANKILEASRFEISIEHSNLAEEVEKYKIDIKKLEEVIKNLSTESTEETVKEKVDFEEEKGSREIADMVELTKKIELLEQLNCQIRQTNKELENKLALVNTDPKVAANSPNKKGSPLQARKGGRATASKMKSPWSQLSSETLNQDTDKKINKNELSKLEMMVQSLNKDLIEKELIISQKDTLLSEKDSQILEKQNKIEELEAKKVHTTKADLDLTSTGTNTESAINVKESDVPEEDSLSTENEEASIEGLEGKLKSANEQIIILNNEIDAANKNMIKVKSENKNKIKQMQKTIDNFRKVSDSNAEIVRLNEEVHQLSQKVAVLEEEKGNLQLHLVDYDSNRMDESEVYKKMIDMENLAETRLKAISVLETQKFELVQDLHVLQQKYNDVEDKLADLSQLQSEQLCTEMKSVQLEEQIDSLSASIKELELIIENLKLDKEQLNSKIQHLEQEKEEIMHKLEIYIQENMDLTDKLEKMSAEKVSSAESIEIVESLTTQEKLELEEYQKGISKGDDHDAENMPSRQEKQIEHLVEESTDLHKRIELFTQEREEILDKMSKLNVENESLHQNIADLNNKCCDLQNNIDKLLQEKSELHNLNQELNRHIEELKNERITIVKETAELSKGPNIEDVVDAAQVESQQDEKLAGEKGLSRTKSVKQLTKEILKLKNTIKERENEIADCQMKILSMEEQHEQKQNEALQNSSNLEMKIKTLTDDNEKLRQEIAVFNKEKDSEHQTTQYQQVIESLQQEMQKLHSEYSGAVTTRDTRINELENLLVEYEKQIFNYGNTLQQKDKEINEYINQVTKLNDVSQKLKSTIELLEEEKAKDQNAELVKSLNKQISAHQKKLTEYEDKLRLLEEEKVQFITLKTALENKYIGLEVELQKLQESYNEKQTLLKELQSQQNKHADEVSTLLLQNKERDEEIHEMKLQLRKESIENEKLRTALNIKDSEIGDLVTTINENKNNFNQLSDEKEGLKQEFIALENKNKDLLEKLKKFAVNIKKKSAMYTELEATYNETEKQLQQKNVQIENLILQVETLPHLQEKLRYAEQEINRLQSLKSCSDQEKENLGHLRDEITMLQDKLSQSKDEVFTSILSVESLQEELNCVRKENKDLKSQIDTLNKKIVEHEIEQKNHINFSTKIASLENDIHQKENQIAEMLTQIEQEKNQIKNGFEAKIQERDLYIENLDSENSKYHNRISRLEETISMMEDRRYSLERKADQLGTQLQEKQKAYSEYTTQEDDLINRLAVLIDHDSVVEKQLNEIEHENKDLRNKYQIASEENKRLNEVLLEIQQNHNNLLENAGRVEVMELEIVRYQAQVHDLDTHLKRITHDHQTLISQKKNAIEELEQEFNTQIESAIKDKKVLNEKYEKLVDHVKQVELQLQEYKSNIEQQNIHIEELNKMNLEMIDKYSQNHESVSSDYTEQYISEINNLNSTVKNLEADLAEVTRKMSDAQLSYVATASEMNNKISDLSEKLENTIKDKTTLQNQLIELEHSNNQLQISIIEKEEFIRELKQTKSLTFEMNIPKTEGMVISSRIEPIGQSMDLASIESQIISDSSEPPIFKMDASNKTSELTQKESAADSFTSEPVMVAKKAYLCYGEEKEKETDPFNSDEGWGFDAREDAGNITPSLSELNMKIQQLQRENSLLKDQLNTNNAKLGKALKKLKELKTSNDMLSNELKITKQISESGFLDTAIEDELQIKIKDLEKNIEDLTADLKKEKREKESVKKQNEIFNNASERLTELKEKLENEIELWKFKFKEANDKLSTMHWDGEDKESTQQSIQKQHAHPLSESHDSLKEEINKIEKENDELQSLVDQLSSQNKELLNNQNQLKSEIISINKQLERQTNISDDCNKLKNNLETLEVSNSQLMQNNIVLSEKVHELESRILDVTQKYEDLETVHEETKTCLSNENKDLVSLLQSAQCEVEKQSEALKSVKQNETDLVSKANECLELKSRLEVSTNKITELQMINSELSEKIQAYEQQLGEFRANINQLKADNQDLVNSLAAPVPEKQIDLDTDRKIKEFEVTNSELLGQVKNYQHQIEELETNISKLTTKNSDLLSTITALQSAKQNNSDTSQSEKFDLQIQAYEEKINELSSKVLNLNTENDNLLSTVTELRASISSAVDQRGFEIAELWKQHLSQREADFQNIEHELRSQLSAFETKYEQLLDNVQSSSQEETNKLVMMEQISTVQNKLQDKEEHLRNLQEKYSEVNHQIEILRSEIEDEKLAYENKILEQQEEYERLIKELRLENQTLKETQEQSLITFDGELQNQRTVVDELKQQNEDLTSKVAEAEAKILDLVNQMKMKEIEVYQKTQEYNIVLAQRNDEFETIRQQLIDYEKKIEEISYEKESELAILRLKLHENKSLYDSTHEETENEKSKLIEELNAKITECTVLNKQVSDLNKSLEEHVSKITEMQAALENQEFDIVSLKDEIAHLQNLLKTSNTKVQKHVSFASDTKGDSMDQPESSLQREFLDAVPRAELDLALYMLHQRDVRCEELTMELTQLLEERDTLQLRLSDSLRSVEELKVNSKSDSLDESSSSILATVSELPSFSVEREQQFVETHRGQTSRSSSVSDADGEKPKLQAKLSELRSVRHSRDVRLRHESEQRQMDLRLLQRDVANLPPEAVEQLAQAHHTLSRDSQSTSTVLLNWLRGKSTPKIVHM